MNNQTETISGRLLQFYGEWKVRSGYGTFPLSKSLRSKPDVSANGSWVEGTVTKGEVTDYHFAKETI